MMKKDNNHNHNHNHDYDHDYDNHNNDNDEFKLPELNSDGEKRVTIETQVEMKENEEKTIYEKEQHTMENDHQSMIISPDQLHLNDANDTNDMETSLNSNTTHHQNNSLATTEFNGFPVAPLKITLTRKTEKSLSIRWKAECDKGDCGGDDEYIIEMKCANACGKNNLRWTLVYQGSNVQYTVPNLLPGVTYLFRGKYFSWLGNSDWSTIVRFITCGVQNPKKEHPPIHSNIEIAELQKQVKKQQKKTQKERKQQRQRQEQMNKEKKQNEKKQQQKEHKKLAKQAKKAKRQQDEQQQLEKNYKKK